MTWEEFRKQSNIIKDYEDTDIECPECGVKIKKYIREVLTTYPPKYIYSCLNCGWSGIA